MAQVKIDFFDNNIVTAEGPLVGHSGVREAMVASGLLATNGFGHAKGKVNAIVLQPKPGVSVHRVENQLVQVIDQLPEASQPPAAA